MGVTSSDDVDVGLSVEPDREHKHIGLTVHAQELGVLKLAVELPRSGPPRLTALERLHGGRAQPATVAAEVRVLELEAEVARAELALVRFEMHAADKLAEAITARDEARDRAAAYADQVKALTTTSADTEADLERQLRDARAALQLEREGRLSALSDRERARAELQGEIDALKTNLAAAQGEVVEARTRAEASVSDVESRVQSLELDLAAARLRGDDAEERTVTAEAKLLEAQGQARDADDRVRVAEEKVLAAEARAVDAEGRLENEQTLSESRSNAARAEADELQTRIADLEMKVAIGGDAAAKVTELEAERVVLRDELAAARAEAERLAELEAHLGEKDGRIAELQTRVEDAETNVNEMRGRLMASEQTALELQGRADEAEGLRAQLEELQTKGTEADDLRAQLEEQQMKTAELPQLQAQVAEVDELRSRLQAFEQTALELQQRSDELEAVRAQLEEREQAALDAQARATELEADLKAASGRAAELQNATTSVNDAEARLATVIAERDEARAIARQVQTTSAKLLAERDEARNVARTLHAQVEPLKAEVKALRDRASSSRPKVATDPMGVGTGPITVPGKSSTGPTVRPGKPDTSLVPTRPYDLQRIRGGHPPGPEWGEESTITEPITAGSDSGTDPSRPAYKPKKG
jgi:chromosome segregation ATPase